MKIYLAGPIRGIPGLNEAAFDYAAEKLRADGHEVFNPVEETRKIYGDDIYKKSVDAKTQEPVGVSGRIVFANDTRYICLHADAVALLPGWEKSSGATAENYIGKALGLTIIILGKEYAR